MPIICRCGAIISDDAIEFWNASNEEGEEYGVVTAECKSCGVEYETSQWGEWDSKEDAMQYLSNYINSKPNSI